MTQWQWTPKIFQFFIIKYIIEYGFNTKIGEPHGLCASRYVQPHRTRMHVFPLCGIRPTVVNTCEIKPLDSNPRYTFKEVCIPRDYYEFFESYSRVSLCRT